MVQEITKDDRFNLTLLDILTAYYNELTLVEKSRLYQFYPVIYTTLLASSRINKRI